MTARTSKRSLGLGLFVTLSLAQSLLPASAGEILVADRLTNAVYRYSDSGAFLGTLFTDTTNLNAPAGIGVSPDHKELYVASSQNSELVRYDYNYSTGTVSNPTVLADSTKGLAFPNSITFSGDGKTIYVSNLGGTGIAQLNLDGSSAGPNITGGTSTQLSGMAFAPGGQLLVGGFDGGTVAESNAGISSLSDFIGPSAALSGAAGLYVTGNDLYVTGLFGTTLTKYDATTGAIDGSFGVSGLAFPQGIIAAPDGNGILLGILGFANGAGMIERYSLTGADLGLFAAATPQALPGNPQNGFVEATAFVHVPEPSTIGLLAMAISMLGVAAWRRSAN